MAYSLSAFVGRDTELATVVELTGQPAVQLQQGLALVPATPDVVDRAGGREESSFGETFELFTAGLEALARTASTTGPVAYLEADMFGGDGYQATVGFHAGEVAFAPEHSADAFNYALRWLGIRPGPREDEFDAAGLGRYRSNEEWSARTDDLDSQ